jgi:hypothetical protein
LQPNDPKACGAVVGVSNGWFKERSLNKNCLRKKVHGPPKVNGVSFEVWQWGLAQQSQIWDFDAKGEQDARLKD